MLRLTVRTTPESLAQLADLRLWTDLSRAELVARLIADEHARYLARHARVPVLVGKEKTH